MSDPTPPSVDESLRPWLSALGFRPTFTAADITEATAPGLTPLDGRVVVENLLNGGLIECTAAGRCEPSVRGWAWIASPVRELSQNQTATGARAIDARTVGEFYSALFKNDDGHLRPPLRDVPLDGAIGRACLRGMHAASMLIHSVRQTSPVHSTDEDIIGSVIVEYCWECFDRAAAPMPSTPFQPNFSKALHAHTVGEYFAAMLCAPMPATDAHRDLIDCPSDSPVGASARQAIDAAAALIQCLHETFGADSNWECDVRAIVLEACEVFYYS